ncbi:hypothetical protein ABZY19_39915 [Streptomyces sp. NPDC006475]|uniref:hypothetical protein n=1 Tax=Streptomyces sp. NPDC006475 TaxID=3155719 RepID=UPI0033BA8C22
MPTYEALRRFTADLDRLTQHYAVDSAVPWRPSSRTCAPAASAPASASSASSEHRASTN